MQEIERSRLSIHPAIRHPYKHRFRCLRPTHKLPRPPDSSVKFNGSYGEHRKIAISSWKRLLCRLHPGKDGGGIAIPPVISGGGEGLLISCFIGRGYNACLRPPTHCGSLKIRLHDSSGGRQGTRYARRRIDASACRGGGSFLDRVKN